MKVYFKLLDLIIFYQNNQLHPASLVHTSLYNGDLKKWKSSSVLYTYCMSAVCWGKYNNFLNTQK